MTIFDWGIFGALILAILIFCARLMRRGIVSLDDRRSQYIEKIHAGELQLAEDRKKISSREHLAIMRSALEDLIRLDDNPPGWQVIQHDKTLEFITPENAWTIELVMRERNLATTGQTLHGKSRWTLIGSDRIEQHAEPISLMASLNKHIHNSDDDFENLPHLQRKHSDFYNN